MNKRYLIILAALLFVSLLCSCGNTDNQNVNQSTEAAAGNTTAAATTAAATSAAAAADDGDEATTAAETTAAAATTAADATTAGSSQGSGISAPDTFPITDEKVTLRVFYVQSLFLGDMYTNAAVQWLEDKTNVHIEWNIASNADAEQKAGLMLASQSDLPDVFMTSAVSREQMFAYGDEGIFIDLNPYIESQGVNTKKMFENKPHLKPQLMSLKGSFYALPEYSECYHCTMRQKMWINTQWMRNLNLEMPETTEEFYNVLKAFKEQDANGNGDPNDEVPLIAVPDAFLGAADYYIMNSFTYNAGMAYNDWLALKDDKIYACYTTDGWREGLRYLKRLYSDGLLDKESFIMSDEQARMYVSDPNGNRLGAFARNAADTVIGSADQKFEYEVLPPLAGPDGTRQTTLYPPSLTPYYFITKTCENPEVAFKWGDMFMRDWVADIKDKNFDWFPMWLDTEGITWEKAQEGDVGLDGKTPAVYRELFTYGDPSNDWLYGGSPGYSTYELRLYLASDPNVWNLEQVVWDATDLYAPYAVDQIVPDLLFSQDDAAEVGELKSLLKDYIQESMAKFVTGVNDLDRDWDNYLSELDSIGVNKMIDILQRSYDTLY